MGTASRCTPGSQAVPTLTWCSCGQGILELCPGPLLISVLDLLTCASQFRAGKGQGSRSHHSGRASEVGAASPGTRQTSWRRGQCGGAHAVPTGLCQVPTWQRQRTFSPFFVCSTQVQTGDTEQGDDLRTAQATPLGHRCRNVKTAHTFHIKSQHLSLPSSPQDHHTEGWNKRQSVLNKSVY